jgi:hypothetical protein
MTTITIDANVGHWRILSLAHRRALCRCRCGAVHEVSVAALEDGTSRSCGCAPASLVSHRALDEARRERQRRQNFDWQPERGR